MMCRFRLDGLGGQDGDNVYANERWGERADPRDRSRTSRQTTEFVYLGEAISAEWAGRNVELTRRLQRAWACFGRYKIKIYDRPGVRLRLKMRMLRAEVIETLL